MQHVLPTVVSRSTVIGTVTSVRSSLPTQGIDFILDITAGRDDPGMPSSKMSEPLESGKSHPQG